MGTEVLKETPQHSAGPSGGLCLQGDDRQETAAPPYPPLLGVWGHLTEATQ